MTSEFTVRAANTAEFATAIEWAAREGWNPGLDDLPAFHAADPSGFLMGFQDGLPVSSVSVVRYGDGFGFLGFYIAHPDFRGKGFGWQTWQAGMAHLAGRTIGLDGVVAQQDNYRKSGFVLSGRNIRHAGKAGAARGQAGGGDVQLTDTCGFDALQSYDRRLFPAERAAFLRQWTLNDGTARRQTLYAKRDGRLCGYGTIRSCRSGYKIGPLFADDRAVAEALFTGLAATVEEDAEVILDVPEANREAVALAQARGMQPVFETARMYRGDAPDLDQTRIFGITSFELG